jgi:hypothetical protein
LLSGLSNSPRISLMLSDRFSYISTGIVNVMLENQGRAQWKEISRTCPLHK